MSPAREVKLEGSVGIVGLGVVGGSLARALTSAGYEVAGFDADPATSTAAVETGALSRLARSAVDLAGEVDLVCYAVSMDTVTGMLRDHRPVWRSDAVITDVSSMKRPVMAVARDLGVLDRFVGAHPMAGSHARGFGASHDRLFRGARVWLVSEGASGPARSLVASLWEAVGGDCDWIDAESHDRRMLLVSQVPQLLSTILADLLDSQGLAEDDLGPGGKGMTRLAASSIDMWLPLLRAGGADLAQALRGFSRRADAVAEAVEGGDDEVLVDLFRRAGLWRRVE
jgi:prephenate dehydrogenase